MNPLSNSKLNAWLEDRIPLACLPTPVHHYPRLHGRSQFFRFRSLLKTFYQLAKLYLAFCLLLALNWCESTVLCRFPSRT